MKISLSILSKFLDIRDVPVQELAQRLTMSGIEVAAIENPTSSWDRVVVGRIQSVVPHPQADRLSVTEIEIPGERLTIVCGAKNIAPGDVVPVALEGAVLPGEFKIKRAKIRGIESHGMICSERELGLAEASEGIMHLPPDAPLGHPVGEVLKTGGITLELEVTPNRADCLSHLGIGRQISAILNRPLQLPLLGLSESGPSAAKAVSVEIEPGCGCGRYCARVITGVRIGPSPAWLKDALESLGLRSINNIVDITNYVLMEIGHPLHAFDLNRLNGKQIKVRRALAGETLATLDGQTRRFSGGELIIADANSPIALAGVMGGAESEVSETTTDILLESAWFDPQAVRRSARAFNLHTEASFRFERGTDPENGLLLALDRAAALMAEVSGGQVLPGVVNEYPLPKPQVQIDLDWMQTERLLGMRLEKATAIAALSKLGFLVEATGNPEISTVRVPSFRSDVTLPEDLAEEIAQMTGYDNIPSTTPRVPLLAPAADARRGFLQETRNILAGLGCHEVINYSFMHPQHFTRLRLPQDHAWRLALQLKNPLSEETSLMRPSLLPGLVETVAYNQRRGQDRIFIFETGAVFLPQTGETLPREPRQAGLAMTGYRHAPDWRLGKNNPEMDFYDLKGMLEALLARLPLKPTHPGGPGFVFRPQAQPFLHPAASFVLVAPDRREIGWAGALHPEAQMAYKLRTAVWVAEINLDALWSYYGPRHGMKQLSRFPGSIQDLALAVPETTSAGEVIKAIQSQGGPLLQNVIPFDVYRGEGLPPGMKSLAFSLLFQSQERTLQDEEIKALHEAILKHLQQAFGAKQR